ncbi:hypothetical protein ONS95_001181 [Cadophora gregata]|uniref:uncharacterized protein n=1 Tax=Cadophora gregata TaxID=51156 RepID=UPI0026DDCC02|nr:uncharacterized protein ONS95_001181 [Cadophora gregata]KAK0129246.1 hypothetical protein ONS95_001181 [Cadophora gregata]
MAPQSLEFVSSEKFTSRITDASDFQASEINAIGNRFWEERLQKRRNLDYDKIKSKLMPSGFEVSAMKKIMGWVIYENNIIDDLLKGMPEEKSNASLSWGGPHPFIRELKWTLERRQMLLQSLSSEWYQLKQGMDATPKVDNAQVENGIAEDSGSSFSHFASVINDSKRLIQRLGENLTEEDPVQMPDEKSTVSIESVLELAIQCLLNTMSPDMPIRDVVRTVEKCFPKHDPKDHKYVCVGPPTIFFSRSELGLLLGGTAQTCIKGGSNRVKNVHDYLRTQREDMLKSLDKDRVPLFEKCTKAESEKKHLTPEEASPKGPNQSLWPDGGIYAENIGQAVTMLNTSEREYFGDLDPCMKCGNIYGILRRR